MGLDTLLTQFFLTPGVRLPAGRDITTALNEYSCGHLHRAKATAPGNIPAGGINWAAWVTKERAGEPERGGETTGWGWGCLEGRRELGWIWGRTVYTYETVKYQWCMTLKSPCVEPLTHQGCASCPEMLSEESGGWLTGRIVLTLLNSLPCLDFMDSGTARHCALGERRRGEKQDDVWTHEMKNQNRNKNWHVGQWQNIKQWWVK